MFKIILIKKQIFVLFSKATQGKCNVPKPGMMDLVGKAKWNAWNDLGSLSQVCLTEINL